MNIPEFGVLPPYFEFSEADTIEQDIKAAIANLMLGGRRMCPQMAHLVKMSYASICFHHQYLDDKVHR